MKIGKFDVYFTPEYIGIEWWRPRSDLKMISLKTDCSVCNGSHDIEKCGRCGDTGLVWRWTKWPSQIRRMSSWRWHCFKRWVQRREPVEPDDLPF